MARRFQEHLVDLCCAGHRGSGLLPEHRLELAEQLNHSPCPKAQVTYKLLVATRPRTDTDVWGWPPVRLLRCRS